MWYARANGIENAGSPPNYRGYTHLQIPKIPNLSVAYRTLKTLARPEEFEWLNINLYPVLMQFIDSDNIQSPPELSYEQKVKEGKMNSNKKRRFLLIGKAVLSYWDEKAEGVKPKLVYQMLREGGEEIPEDKVSIFMKEMYEMGLLQRTGVPATNSVRYYPIGVRSSSNSH